MEMKEQRSERRQAMLTRIEQRRERIAQKRELLRLAREQRHKES